MRNEIFVGENPPGLSLEAFTPCVEASPVSAIHHVNAGQTLRIGAIAPAHTNSAPVGASAAGSPVQQLSARSRARATLPQSNSSATYFDTSTDHESEEGEQALALLMRVRLDTGVQELAVPLFFHTPDLILLLRTADRCLALQGVGFTDDRRHTAKSGQHRYRGLALRQAH